MKETTADMLAILLGAVLGITVAVFVVIFLAPELIGLVSYLANIK